MFRTVRRDVFSVALLLSATTGCIRVDFGLTPKATIRAEETRSLPVADARSLDIETYNGAVTAGATDDTGGQFIVRVTRQARAWTRRDARDCLDAIELITDRVGDTQKLGWRWKTPRRPGWSADVRFDVRMPKDVAVSVHTHNGAVTVTGLTGDCDLSTHNGAIRMDTLSRRVNVRTHNGRIHLAAAPEHIQAVTHNGTIHAEFLGDHNVAGRVVTHNGGVTIAMAPSASANFACGTHNGGIRADLNLADVSTSGSSLSGRYGDADDELRVTTHNGSITLTGTP